MNPVVTYTVVSTVAALCSTQVARFVWRLAIMRENWRAMAVMGVWASITVGVLFGRPVDDHFLRVFQEWVSQYRLYVLPGLALFGEALVRYYRLAAWRFVKSPVSGIIGDGREFHRFRLDLPDAASLKWIRRGTPNCTYLKPWVDVGVVPTFDLQCLGQTNDAVVGDIKRSFQRFLRQRNHKKLCEREVVIAGIRAYECCYEFSDGMQACNALVVQDGIQYCVEFFWNPVSEWKRVFDELIQSLQLKS